MKNEVEKQKKPNDQIILNMEKITSRSQQIAALSVVVCIIIGVSTWIWGFIFITPMNARIAHDEEQDRKIELILENQKKQDQQYFEIRKDQAVYGEKVNQIYASITDLRDRLKDSYKGR